MLLNTKTIINLKWNLKPGFWSFFENNKRSNKQKLIIITKINSKRSFRDKSGIIIFYLRNSWNALLVK